MAIATIVMLSYQQWHDGPFRLSTASRRMPELDFALLWAAGKWAAVADATRLYDGPTFLAWREHLFGPGLFRLDWIYPPPMIALGLAVSRLPLLGAYLLWMAAIGAGSVWVLRRAGLSWRVVLLGLFGPPIWRGLTSGQVSPLAASLVVAGLLQARRTPVRAGLQVALATLKPHLGILVPVVWIAQRRLAAFAVAAAGTFVLAGISLLLFGPGIWAAFLHGSGVSARLLLEPRTPAAYWGGAASVYWMARSFGLSVPLSYDAQGAAAVLALAATIAAARRGGDTAMMAVTTCLILLVSPYLNYSDLVGYSVVVAMILERRPTAALPMALWIFPGVSSIVSVLTGWQVLPVCVVTAAFLAWREFGPESPAPAEAGAPAGAPR